MLSIGSKWPRFKVKACVRAEPDGLIEITNQTYKGKWLVVFFYPKDFTFVCPTELAEFGRREKDFRDRGAVLLGGSTDNEYSHLAWRQSHPHLRTLPYPLIAAQQLAADLGIIDPAEGVCLRATFIVDPENTIQWVSVNNLNVGRNVTEILRVLEAIQSNELTPCGWTPGDPYLKVAG